MTRLKIRKNILTLKNLDYKKNSTTKISSQVSLIVKTQIIKNLNNIISSNKYKR